MEEIKVGDYVRTKEGEIIKVREDYNIFTDDDGLFIDAYMLPYEQKIIKHSPNIIDIIEEGDYVNGEKVSNVDKYDNIYTIEWEYGNVYTTEIINDKFIKDIVTKEQFNQVKYEV